jgi:hypothetical protein
MTDDGPVEVVDPGDGVVLGFASEEDCEQWALGAPVEPVASTPATPAEVALAEQDPW